MLGKEQIRINYCYQSDCQYLGEKTKQNKKSRYSGNNNNNKKEGKNRNKQEEDMSLPPPSFQVSFSASHEKV